MSGSRWVLLALALVGCPAQIDETDTDTDTDTAPIDADNDGYAVDEDCDDDNADVNPGATEICNGIDDNCDDVIDTDATDRFAVYTDADRDGYGNSSTESLVCERPTDSADVGGDCDDANDTINPGATEICDPNDVDEDCDGSADDDDDSTDPATKRPYWLDADKDGFGDPERSVRTCEQPDGYVTDKTDCDDTDPAVNPELGCPTVWDGTWDGTLTLDVTAVSVGISDSCTTTGSLVLDRTASPQLQVGSSGPWICDLDVVGELEIDIEGDFTGEDTLDAELLTDGNAYPITIRLSETDGMTSNGTQSTKYGSFDIVLGHDLSATRR